MPTSKVWTNSREEQMESTIVRSALGRAVGRRVKFGLALSITAALLAWGTAVHAQAVQCKCNASSLPNADHGPLY